MTTTEIRSTEQKPKHTPGPWHVSGYSDINGNYLHIGAKGSPMVLASMNAVHIDTAANARVIAAIPELIQALQEIAGYSGADSELDYNAAMMRETARAALRKLT